MPPPKSDADIVPTYVLDALEFAMTTTSENEQCKNKSVLAAIANSRRVKNALARFPVDAKAVERVDCALVTRLLNCISVSYHEHGYGSKGHAVIFGSLDDSTPAGNWNGHAAKPTYTARGSGAAWDVPKDRCLGDAAGCPQGVLLAGPRDRPADRRPGAACGAPRELPGHVTVMVRRICMQR